jgi:diacylglycerol kinase (ATP)
MSNLPHFWNAIINPNSFRGKSLTYWSRVKSHLWERGFTFKECDSPTSEHCNDIVAHLLGEGHKNFLVVGGDGTLNEVVNALYNNSFKTDEVLLAVVPAGTGNDWSRTHNIQNTPEKIVQMFTGGEIFYHDVGRITVSNEQENISRYVINIAGLGFDAEVIRRIVNTKQPRYGSKLIYLKNLFGALSGYRPVLCRIAFDDSEVEMPVFTAAAGICRYNGHKMKQVPMAQPDDGYLDVVYIEPLTFFELMVQLPRLYSGRHVEFRKVHHQRTKSVSFFPSGKLYAEVEGELLTHGNIHIEIIPQQIRVLRPKQS